MKSIILHVSVPFANELFYSNKNMCLFFIHLGFYWIDPNDGIPDDAIRVHCDHFTHSSCLYPHNKTEVI